MHEKVTIIADLHDHDGKQGIVQMVKLQHIEVELTGGEGLVSVAWKKVQKCYSIGDFVQVSHGPYQGLGWVVDVCNDEINCKHWIVVKNAKCVDESRKLTEHKENLYQQ